MKYAPTFVAIGTVLCLLIGCVREEPLTVQLLSGTYVLKYRHGTETLELHKDGTYAQRYVSSSQKEPVLNEGKWSIDFVGGKIAVYDALLFDTGRNERRVPPIRTGWSLLVLQASGRIELPVDPDRALVFEKQ
jgi:hypothetical protein